MQDDLTLQAYAYDLPAANIAQTPADRRDESRLLVLSRTTGTVQHLHFKDILQFFRPGDLLVLNDTKVFPARLAGTKGSGGKAEVFLLNYPALMPGRKIESVPVSYTAEALIRSSRPPGQGSRISFGDRCSCIMLENRGRGKWLINLQLDGSVELLSFLTDYGQVPLPPYIKREAGPHAGDTERYQTVYARQPGAVAAPTAGLHFTEELLDKLPDCGISVAAITLHVGHGTFAPVEAQEIREHVIHEEFVEISPETATRVNETKARGGSIWAVGTTTARTLEFGARENGTLEPISGWCDLYITPGYTYRLLDNLITNFHLPQSSLMFLVAALCGRQNLLACYREAIEHEYRFYSYGDAMAIVK
jgi:S-adenosylmethionine:tRNA ribosyltransferase-isomerase